MAFGALEVVDRPFHQPQQCLLTNDITGPFLDTGRYINWVDPYCYISVNFVKEMGRAVGMVAPEEIEELKDEVARMQSELSQLRSIADKLTAAEGLKVDLEAYSNGA